MVRDRMVRLTATAPLRAHDAGAVNFDGDAASKQADRQHDTTSVGLARLLLNKKSFETRKRTVDEADAAAGRHMRVWIHRHVRVNHALNRADLVVGNRRQPRPSVL